MKTIPLTQSKVALVDDSDYDWLMQWKWLAVKDGSTFYAARSIRLSPTKTKTIRMHRVILGLENSTVLGDHEDGNGLNNQRYNLRVADYSQNSCNAKPHGDRRFKGVHWNKKRGMWKAEARSKGKYYYFGYYHDQEEAAKIYNTRVSELQGAFARLNVI